MKKSNKKEIAFRNRVKETVSTIYTATSGTPLNEGFARYRKNGLFAHCGSILRQMGVIENIGNPTNPSYVWRADVEPSRKLFDDVIDAVKERHKNKGAKTAVKSISVPDILPVEVVPSSEPVRAVLALTNFTDQQLWDELKSRNYAIVGGKLSKTVYLQ